MAELHYNGRRGEHRSGPYHADPDCAELSDEEPVRTTTDGAVDRDETDPEYCSRCAGAYLPSGSGSDTGSDDDSEETEAEPEEIILEADEAEEEHVCEECGRGFDTPQGLASHSRVHSDD